MERYTMFLAWKNQYCKNDSTTQSNLQTQCNLIKLPMAFSQNLNRKNFKSVCKHKRSGPTKGGKENGAGGIRLPELRLTCM